MGVADKPPRQLADVHQAAVVQPDIHKHPKVHDVENCPHQFHAHLEILELEHTLLKKGPRQVFTRIPTGPGELVNDVVEQQPPHFKLGSERIEIELADLLGELLCPLPAREVFHTGSEPLQHPLSHRIAFRMNPGGIERIAAATDLEKAGSLHVGRLAEARHIQQLLPVGKGPLGSPPLQDAAGDRLIEPRNIAEQRGARCVDVDTDVVDAALDNTVERGMQMLGAHIVLIKAHADVGRLDLHQL